MNFPGWTLDYIDNGLTEDDKLQIAAVQEAIDKSRPKKDTPPT